MRCLMVQLFSVHLSLVLGRCPKQGEIWCFAGISWHRLNWKSSQIWLELLPSSRRLAVRDSRCTSWAINLYEVKVEALSKTFNCSLNKAELKLGHKGTKRLTLAHSSLGTRDNEPHNAVQSSGGGLGDGFPGNLESHWSIPQQIITSHFISA